MRGAATACCVQRRDVSCSLRSTRAMAAASAADMPSQTTRRTAWPAAAARALQDSAGLCSRSGAAVGGGGQMGRWASTRGSLFRTRRPPRAVGERLLQSTPRSPPVAAQLATPLARLPHAARMGALSIRRPLACCCVRHSHPAAANRGAAFVADRLERHTAPVARFLQAQRAQRVRTGRAPALCLGCTQRHEAQRRLLACGHLQLRALAVCRTWGALMPPPSASLCMQHPADL